MESFRRCLSPLATFLAVLIAIQVTDVIVCADEAEAADRAGQHEAGERPASGDPHEGSHHQDDESAADCLCHIVFAPTTVVPALGGRPAPEALPVALAVDAPPEVEPDGPEHVPLG